MIKDKSKLVATSRLFSSAVLQQFAKKGTSAQFTRLLREIGPEPFLSAQSVSDAFELAFKFLATPGHRDEYVYKSAITKKVLMGRHNLNTAVMLSELRVEGNKADIVVLNGTSTVYEIKSERDGLTRLPRQLDAYRRAFASVNVITHESHVAKVMAMAPGDVGVLVLNRRGQISKIRECLNCPERIEPTTLFESLRTREAIEVLRQLGVDVPEVPNTQRFGVLRSLFSVQKPDLLHSAVVGVLRQSRSQRKLSCLLGQLPDSLHAAALATPIRPNDQTRFVDAIKKPLDEAALWA